MKNFLNKKLKLISKIILLVLSLSFSYSFAYNKFLRDKLALIAMLAQLPSSRETAKEEIFKAIKSINSGEQFADQEEINAILAIVFRLEITIQEIATKLNLTIEKVISLLENLKYS